MATLIAIPDPDLLDDTEGEELLDEAATAAASLLEQHRADSTDVHGIPDTALLETKSGAQEKADAAQAASNVYTDIKLGEQTFKPPVRVIATGNVNIASPGTSNFDGLTMFLGDPVLLVGQTNPAENWIWEFNGPSSAMTRRDDSDSGAEVSAGTSVVVNEGSQGGQIWTLRTTGTIVLGTTPLTITLASGDTSGLATTAALAQLDSEVVKSVNGTLPTAGDVGVPGVYRGLYADLIGRILYINDVVNDGTTDRRVTTQHVAGASINLNNFASPASVPPDTLIGVPAQTVETDAKHGYWPVRSRLRPFSLTRTRLTRFRSRTVTDGATVNGTNGFTSTLANFTAADVNSGIIAPGLPNGTKIQSVTSTSVVVLTANATATASALTTTISADASSSSQPAQISSDADPCDTEGCIRLRGTGSTAATVTKTLAAPVDISNHIIRIGVRLSSLRSGVAECKLEASSNNFADSNYKVWNMCARNEFRVGSEDIWDVIGTGPADWFDNGTGANLSSINALRVRFRRDTGVDLFLSIAYVDAEPITNTKAKCVLWFDDGFTDHWIRFAPLLHSYGFRGTLAPNILEPTAMTPTQMRYLQDHFGWQVAMHARTSAEHTTITGDSLRQNWLNSRHAHNAFGLSGGDDFAWWGGLGRDLANTREARKMFRSARLAIARIGETLPPVNPLATTALQFLEGMTWATDMQPWAEKAIVNKGVAQFVFHATTNTYAMLQSACTWLNANRASIDVVTWEEAIRPWTYSA